ncbi:MAG TPA: NAD(P)-dependent oxidoreductase [Rhodoblastus sp.]|nr:NAD(P)-dependent oxidoreductase [Rhodoblastus sp.]
MADTIRHVIVTGGRGYLGRAFVEAAVAAGLRVTLLARGAGAADGLRCVDWRLGEGLPAEALADDLAAHEQALVHFAHDWRDLRPDGVNVAGSLALRDGAREKGLGRFVFISSQSARQDALNAYGRMKWRIEQTLDGGNEISLRVGLVYGGPRAAQYGLLCKAVGLTSLMPMVRPHQLVQPILREEVARGALNAVNSDLSGALGLAGAKPIPFSQFLDTLARLTRGGGVTLAPIPLAPTLFLCDIVNALPLLPNVDRERVLGLAGTRPMETENDLARLKLVVVSFEDGMAREPIARKAMLREGRILLRYVLRAEPGAALLRRYLRACDAKGARGAIRLPFVARRSPALLRFVEPFGARGELAKRLKIATALAETSEEGARIDAGGGRIARLAGLAFAGALDILAAPTRLIAAALRS